MLKDSIWVVMAVNVCVTVKSLLFTGGDKVYPQQTHSLIMDDREDDVYRAQLAEKAERYSGELVDHMLLPFFLPFVARVCL